jgi:hypothetical protein
VRFEKTLTPTAFSTLEDYLPRLSNLTTAYVDWSTPVTEAYSISDDISVPFHEAIGTGATTGVAIHFLENGSDNVSGFGFAGANYEDGGEYHPAVLMVTYTSTPSTTMKMPWYHNN